MKKVLIFGSLIICLFGFAQTMKLTPDGFVDASDSSKKYVVIEFPNASQSELYKDALVMLNKKYRSSKDVLSAVEPESITIDAISSHPVHRTSMHSFTNRYNITISFKDGKIKVDAPSIQLYTYDYGKKQEMFLIGGFTIDGSSFGIYNKKGELKIEKAENDLNQFVNNFIADIKNIQSKEDW